MLSRGIRNNNPLNIRRNPANNWVGAVPTNRVPDTTRCGGESGGTGRPLIKRSGINHCEPVADREFEQFYSMYYGFRAALIIIGNYISRGCNTIEDIVTRWAPPTENKTDKYIRDVCRMTGIGGREPIPLPSASEHSGKYEDERLKNIVAAMAVVESGNAIEDYLIGLNKAFTDYVDRQSTPCIVHCQPST